MTFDDDVPMPPRPGKEILSQSEMIRSMRPGQSVLLPSAEKAAVFRALAFKAFGPGKVSVQRVDNGWRAWRL